MPSSSSCLAGEASAPAISRTTAHLGWTERQITFPCLSPEAGWLRQLEQCGPGIAHLDLFGGAVEIRRAGGMLLGGCRETVETTVIGSDATLPACMQVCAVDGVAMQPVHDCGRLVGHVFEDADAVYCMLGGIRPADVTASRGAQAGEVFSIIQRVLQRHGMEFRNVIRTWFYLDKILGWYAEFNRVRTGFFEKANLGILPASTGVGAANFHGAALVAKAVAVLPKTPVLRIQRAESPLQCEAFSYGSAFSRAVELCDAASRTLYISGTASIEPGGRTIHHGNTARQIEATMEVVEAMLSRSGMRIEDMTRGIAYFRHGFDVPLWGDYCKRRGLAGLPVVAIQCDVCRDDLLFEIELDAAVATNNGHPTFKAELRTR